jgi:hypothetical protein
MRYPAQVISRVRFLEHVWDFAGAGDSNIVDVYVRILRDKIDRPFGTQSIETVRGAGVTGSSHEARPAAYRVTLASAASIALILAALSFFVYARLQAELVRSADSALRTRAEVIASGIGRAGSGALVCSHARMSGRRQQRPAGRRISLAYPPRRLHLAATRHAGERGDGSGRGVGVLHGGRELPGALLRRRRIHPHDLPAMAVEVEEAA